MVSPIMAMFNRPAQRSQRRRDLEIIAPPGVREESFSTLGGIPQWVTIRGQDQANPILLVVHGGPGSTYTPFNSWITAWERSFTVVQWDQRGAGHTYIRSGAPSLTLQRIVADGLELAESLIRTYGRPLVLMGSSVGSLTASLMARTAPHLFSTLVLSNVLAPDSMTRSWTQTLDAARVARSRRAIRKLEQIGPDPRAWTAEQARMQSKIAVQLSRGAPNMVYGLMLPALMYDPALSMSDIRKIDQGMRTSHTALYPDYSSFPLALSNRVFELPVMAIHGEEDLVSPISAARDYIATLVTPRTTFIGVPEVGHLVEFAAPDQFIGHLLEFTQADA